MDVDGVLADAVVDAAVGVGAGSCPSDYVAVLDCDDEWLAVLDPALDLVDRARRGLERGYTFGDPGVVNLGYAFQVARLGGADR